MGTICPICHDSKDQTERMFMPLCPVHLSEAYEQIRAHAPKTTAPYYEVHPMCLSPSILGWRG
jgi:hypothetical protein